MPDRESSKLILGVLSTSPSSHWRTSWPFGVNESNDVETQFDRWSGFTTVIDASQWLRDAGQCRRVDWSPDTTAERTFAHIRNHHHRG